jgi:hypothetical protein
MVKNLGILCTGHCSIPECGTERLKSDGERCLNGLQDEQFMISRCKKLSPTGC